MVTADMDLDLSSEVETALTKGIPMDILIAFSMYRQRRFMWDKKIGEWTLRARLQYHALSDLYLVTLQGSGDPKTFTTQRAGLKYIGTLSRVSFPLPSEGKQKDRRYWLGLRARLDIESLPAPLRPLAYTSSAWRLDSKWTRWTIQP